MNVRGDDGKVHRVLPGARIAVCGAKVPRARRASRGGVDCPRCAKVMAEAERREKEIEAALKKKNPRGKKASAARAEYTRVHWGDPGAFAKQASDVVDLDHGQLIVLGTLEDVTYSTKKGEEGGHELVNYEHDFGRTKPLLCFHRCDRKKCASRGKLAICGGTYRVTERGIVG